jgi:hypothetical protein
VRQDDERGPVRARLVTTEPPAVLRLDGERFEQLCIHRGPRHAARPIAGGEIRLADGNGTDDGEGLVDFGELEIFRHRHRALLDPVAFEPCCQKPELLRVWIREWLQDHGVDDREHRGIRTDADGQCQNRDGGESKSFPGSSAMHRLFAKE